MTQVVTTISGHLPTTRAKSINRQIFRALFSLASAALLVRVMGMFNQVVVSGRFGAGPRMDAYFVASALPILLAQLLASAIEASIVPTYAHVRRQGTKEEATRLFSTLLNLMILSSLLITLVMFLLRTQLIALTAPGSPTKVIELAINLTPFIFPVFFLMVVVNYLECILNTEGQFGWPAYAGMLVPFTTALLVFSMGKALGVTMLCLGMVLGLCLQLCVFVIRARRAGLVYRFVLDIRNPQMASIASAAWPVLLGALISQAGPLIDQIFASFLAAGSISALSYSLKLIGVFTGVIFVSVGRAALPYLSRQASMNDLKGFKETFRLYSWIVGLGTLLLSIFVIAFSHLLVHVLFQRGSFTADDATRTTNTFIGLAVGLAPMSFGFIAYRAFSALGKTRVLMRLTLINILLNALFDYFFSRLWQSEGIALATSAMYVCSMLMLLFALRHEIGELNILTPPIEIVVVMRRVGATFGLSYGQAAASPYSIPYTVQRQIIRLSIVISVFTAGVAFTLINSLYTLRAALASVVMLALIRYNYWLVLLWVLVNAPNGMPIFRGTNILIALTVPTLLLMPAMPIKQTIQRLPALAILFAFLLWDFAGISISPIGLGPFLTAWFLQLDCLAVAILTLNVINTRRRLLGCIDVLLLVTTLIALYGIYGYFTRQNILIDPATGLTRIISIFNAAPGLALLLSLVIPVAIYRMYTLQGFKRIIPLAVVIILLVATALTFTRTTDIALPVSLIIMACFIPSRKVRNSLFGGLVVIAAVVFLLSTIGNFPILGRLFNSDLGTLNGRTVLWQAVLLHFDPAQLLGNGLRASDYLLSGLHVGVNGQGIIGTSPHDLFLGTLFDNGIVGAILLVSTFITLIINLVKGARTAIGEHRVLFAVAIAALVNLLIQSFDSNDFWNQAISVYIWIIMALPFALSWPEYQKGEQIGK
jgi:putative peptidoglycan lipid II flippase